MVTYNDKLSYEIKDNGYEIFLDNNLWITQYEPYAKVFKADGTYEENCLLQLEELSRPPIEPNNDYGLPNDIYNSIIDDYTDELFEMGVL